VSDSSPRLWTGFDTNTDAVPIETPEPGLPAVAAATQTAAIVSTAMSASVLLLTLLPLRGLPAVEP
jgi:hypothetical protein